MQNENIHRLLTAAKSVREVDSGSWTCYCPIHEDGPGIHNNSLSVAAPDDGKIIVHCHNGCDPKDIVYAFGLAWKDCFPPKQESKSKITATYDYQDEDGVLRFQVCRIEPGKDGRKKDFRQRMPDGAGDWTWKTKGLRKFPYRLKELAAADPAQPVFIVEGEKQVDYLRSLGLTATCNPGGAGKWLKPYAKYFDGRDVVVIPDCDPPNERTGKIVGAAHAKEVADSLIGVAKSIHVIELPNCQPKWGLDDWLQDGNTLQDLSEILKTAEPWGPESSIVTEVPVGGEPEGEMEDPITYDRKILKDIGIVYCAETEEMEIEVFSSSFRKFSVIRDPAKLTYPKLLQLAGPLARAKVSQATADDDGKPYSMNEVRNAIGIVAGSGKRGSEKLGAGIWRLNEQVVMVNGNHIAIFDGKTIVKVDSAVHEDHVFDLGNHDEWFDFEQVAGWINRDDRDWVYSSILELCTIIEQWRFKIADPDENPQICAEIIASLIVASLIQSFWTFRPMVFLLGESNCGKSTLIQLLCGEESNPLDSGLIGSLAIHSSNQSAAGIRQMAERSSRPVFVDEFEKGRHRTEILELLRGASRGSQSIRGTAGQKAVTTKLAFMAWAASTESGLVKQVDQNRWIQIQMVPPENAKMGKLKLPSVDEINTLRNKLVAAAVVIGNDARAMVDVLMANRPREKDHRICQIFAVPAAVFATMTGMPQENAVDSYKRMLRTYDHGQVEKDQDSTLDTILTSKIRTGHAEKSLLNLIQLSQNQFAPGSIENEDLLATHGIQIATLKDGSKYVFFVHKVVSRELLRGSSLEGVKIDELLMRLPGAQRDVRRVSGKPMRGVRVPISVILPPDESSLFTEV